MSTNTAAAGAATVTQDLTSQEGAPAERDSELDRWASLSQPVAVDGDAPVEAMVSTPPPPVQNTPRQAQRARRQKIVLAGVCGFGCLVFALAAVRTAAHRADARYAAVTSQGPAATAAQLAPPASIAAGATAATSASGNTSSVALAEPPPLAEKKSAALAKPGAPASTPRTKTGTRTRRSKVFEPSAI